MNLKNRIIGLITFALVMMIVWFVLQNKNQIAKYWDYGTNIPSNYSLLGIDVSHYQGDIYWDEVDKMSIKNDSISFVFIKASEGLDLEDDQFELNTRSALSHEIPFGAYHYFYPNKSAEEQALFFIKEIKDVQFTLKPVMDIELTSDFSNDRIADSILVFLQLVESELSTRPLIYTYQSFFEDNLDDTKVSDELYWIASYNEDCYLFERDNFLIWQFTEKGTVNGISTKVDLNVAKKDFLEKAKR